MKLDFINIRIIERFNLGLKEIRCSDLQSDNNFYDFCFIMGDFMKESNVK